MGKLMHFLKRKSLCKRIPHIPNTLRSWFAEFDLNFFAIGRFLV